MGDGTSTPQSPHQDVCKIYGLGKETKLEQVLQLLDFKQDSERLAGLVCFHGQVPGETK